jgi:hypothetical protein
MVNQGDPRSIKDQIRISGNVVIISGQSVTIAGVTISGVELQISGETVFVVTSGNTLAVSGTVSLLSGTTVNTSVSGDVVLISGQPVGILMSGGSISGQVVWGTGTSGYVWVQTTSGSFVTVSGTVTSILSGGWTTISGTVVVDVSGWISISGWTVLSGGWTTISGTVGIVTSGGMISGAVVWGTQTSGQVAVLTASGSYVSVSGAVSISGNTIVTSVSGNVVTVTGTVITSVSGDVVWGYGTSGQFPVYTVSGSYVSVSGAVSISGNVVSTSVSGNVVVTSVSGNVVTVTGTVITSMSGGTLSGQIVWGYGTSGQFPVYTASGSYVSVSGSVSVSGNVVSTSVSGNVVVITISGGSISGAVVTDSGSIVWGIATSGQDAVVTLSGSYVAVTGNLLVASTISNSETKISSSIQGLISLADSAVSVPTWFQAATLHLSSTQSTSSEFALYHTSFIGSSYYSSKIFSANMNGHSECVFMPDAPYIIFPGASMTLQFTNSGALVCILRLMYSANQP